MKANNRRYRDRHRGRTAHRRLVGRDDRLGPAGEHQDDRPALTHQLKGFKRSVQQEYSPHQKNYRPTDWRRDHFAAATIASGLNGEPELPLTVVVRNAQ